MGRRLLTSLAATAAVATSLLISSAGPATAADSTAAAPANTQSAVAPIAKVPDAVQVKDPTLKIVATLHGVGKQIYDCTPGNPYVLREPAAGLFTSRGVPTGIHGQGPGPGPFWTAFDGSRVDGTRVAVATPEGASPKDIPWVLLSATPHGTGGVFSNVKSIQRIDTKGGAAPASCGAPTVAVDYTANYVFWAPK